MNYPSIRIEGAILSPDILERIEELPGQKPGDFGLDASARVKDEIARAWADAQDYWRIFQRRLETLKADSPATSETRQQWIVPLLGLLGYQLEYQARGAELNGKTYGISHRAVNRAQTPVQIVGYREPAGLDRKRAASRVTGHGEVGGSTADSLSASSLSTSSRMSAHAMVQEYINLTEQLYAIVTNGRVLRLLRDSSRLIKLSYLEFDLDRIFTDGLFADFAILYRLLHASRLPARQDAAAESLIERYHQDSLESGARIRDGLSRAVEQAILDFGNGFLAHPANEALRAAIAAGIRSSEESFPGASTLSRAHDSSAAVTLTPARYYQDLLRLIYRLLFLMVIEERGLVFPPGATAAQREIYRRFYSVQRLRLLSEKRHLADRRRHDLWLALTATFRLFEAGGPGCKLGLAPLAGELFRHGAIGSLAECTLGNDVLLGCLRSLSLYEHPDTRQLIRVNYAALNVEEFGSVYQGLLEYEPIFLSDSSLPLGRPGTLLLSAGPLGGPETPIPSPDHSGTPETQLLSPRPAGEGPGVRAPAFTFAFQAGDERAATGSHYTPEELVQPLIKHSLDYLIAARLEQARAETVKSPSTFAQRAEKALLDLRVADISCGSGHILLAAARRIATELAIVRTGEDQPSPTAYRAALRDVIRTCIYGVDLNPLAVELCKVALWLEAHNPGQPLNFLDHHIKCGNAIVGYVRREEIDKGVPDDAFATMPGDDKDVAARWRKRNKAESTAQAMAQVTMQYSPEIRGHLDALLAQWNALSALPERTPEEIDAKKARFTAFASGPDAYILNQIAAIPIAQFFILKTAGNDQRLVADEQFRRYWTGGQTPQGQATALAWATAHEKRFFHWFMEFPEIMARGGFDCILGNPPYLGGQGLSGTYGHPFCAYVKWEYAPTGLSDLVVFFVRRIYSLLQPGGFTAFITTNSIKDGDIRKDGLEQVLAQGGEINMAVRGIKWPGRANLVVSLVALHKGPPTTRQSPGDGVGAGLIPACTGTGVGAGLIPARTGPEFIQTGGDQSLPDYREPSPQPSPAGRGRFEKQPSPGGRGQGEGNLLTSLRTTQKLGRNIVRQDGASAPWNGKRVLDGREVSTISAHFEESADGGDPSDLPENAAKLFQGSIFLGDGFLLTHDEADRLNHADPRNAEVIFPVINGQEINNEPDQKPGRAIINFHDWSLERAATHLAPYEIVERLVKPERDQQNDTRAQQLWWLFKRPTMQIYRCIRPLPRCFVAAATTKYLNFSAAPTNIVFTHALYVFTTARWDLYAVVQSTLHEVWARKYSGALKQDLRYSPSKCFDTFPFPEGMLTANGATTEAHARAAGVVRQAHHERQQISDNRSETVRPEFVEGQISPPPASRSPYPFLAIIGERYHEHRKALMLSLWLGLTDIYNLFHARDLEQRLELLFKKRAATSQWRATVPAEHRAAVGAMTPERALDSIRHLRELHRELDNTVLAAYGWAGHSVEGDAPSLPPIVLNHDFVEVETLAENDRVRLTISPAARTELLCRLLVLNHARTAAEANKSPAKAGKRTRKSKEPDASGDLFA